MSHPYIPDHVVVKINLQEQQRFWEMAACAALQEADTSSADDRAAWAAKCADALVTEWLARFESRRQ